MILLIGAMMSVTTACSRNIIYENHINMPERIWDHKHKILFKVPIEQEVNNVNLVLNIRHTDKLAHNMLNIKLVHITPNHKHTDNELLIVCKNNNGNYIGEGFSDLWDLATTIEHDVQLMESGVYQFELINLMNKPIRHITSIGFIIQK